jgi:Tfp pilus assembly protein PilZ
LTPNASHFHTAGTLPDSLTDTTGPVEEAMPANERRRAPRKHCTVPLRFRITNITDPFEVFEGSTLNVSETGIFFTADHSLRIGDPVEIFLTLPQELTGRSPERVRCSASIVHVQPGAGESNKTGFGAAISYFQAADLSCGSGN